MLSCMIQPHVLIFDCILSYKALNFMKKNFVSPGTWKNLNFLSFEMVFYLLYYGINNIPPTLWFLEFTYILLPMFLEFCTTVLLISEHSVIYWRNICKSTCKSLKICYFFKCLQNSCFNQQLDKWTYMNELMNCMYIYLTQSKVWTSLVSWACPIHK